MNSFAIFWQSIQQPLRLGNQVFAFSLLGLIIEFILPLVAYGLVSFLVLRHLDRRARAETEGDDLKGADRRRWPRIIIRTGLVVLLVLLGSRFLEIRIVKFFEDLFAFVGKPFYSSGNTRISLLSLLLVLPILYLASLGGKAVRLAFEGSHLLGRLVQDTRRQAILAIVRYSVTAVILVLGMSIIGFDLSSVGVFLGILQAGLLLSMQGVLANFFAGIGLLIGQPVREGDAVSIGTGAETYEGVVEQVRLLHVVLRDRGGRPVLVPSSRVFLGSLRIDASAAAEQVLGLNLDFDANTDIEALERSLRTLEPGFPETRLAILTLEGGKLGTRLTIPIPPGESPEAWRPRYIRAVSSALRKAGIKLI